MSIGQPSGRSSWFGLGRSRIGRRHRPRSRLIRSQAALMRGHLVAGAGDELGRHAAAGQAVRVVLAHQLLPGRAHLLVADAARSGRAPRRGPSSAWPDGPRARPPLARSHAASSRPKADVHAAQELLLAHGQRLVGARDQEQRAPARPPACRGCRRSSRPAGWRRPRYPSALSRAWSNSRPTWPTASGGMRKLRLKASISARFTGPSHLASLADSTTEAMAKNCSRWPSIAASRAALETVRARHGRTRIWPTAAVLRRMAQRRAHDRAERARPWRSRPSLR